MFQSVGRLVICGLVGRRLVDSSEYKESHAWKILFENSANIVFLFSCKDLKFKRPSSCCSSYVSLGFLNLRTVPTNKQVFLCGL